MTNYTTRDLRGIAYSLRNSIAVGGLPFAHIGKTTLAKWVSEGWITRRADATDYYDLTESGRALIDGEA